ncbi:MAG: polysaccharide deacetylase family protein [Bacteroidetes bacterium]|nr:polysaccharide deacetylase family protein [Bacteroidota bacterium]
MLNFRTVTILFFLGLLILNLIHFLIQPIPALYYILLLTAYFGISIGFSFCICCKFHLPVMCRQKTDVKVVALTFDDGPHPEFTGQVLSILKAENIRSTFFIIGKHAEKCHYLVRKMHEDGHSVGNHTFSHGYFFDFLTPRKMRKDIAVTNGIIYQLNGKRPLLFRPPYGVTNPMLKKALIPFSLHIIGWSLRSLDTVSKDPEKTVRRIIKKVKAGDIILLHDNLPGVIPVLHALIPQLREKGFGMIPVNELLNIEAYE